MSLALPEVAWVRGVATWSEADGAPKPDLLPPILRRRTSLLTRVSADLLSRLAARSGAELAALPQVHGSALGEIATTMGLLASMHEDDGMLSPTRFHNSVHNTAAGYLAIVTANMGLTTSIAAGEETVAAALLEAFGLLHTRAREVLVVVVEEPVPEPLRDRASYEGLGAAFHLAREPRPGDVGITLPRRLVVAEQHEVPASIEQNPCARVLLLARALERGTLGSLPLQRTVPGEPVWTAEIVREAVT